ncbi:hypothetical protein W97_08272 [Coniosporium apollinis CBS 100218]|uniref:Uncharacterized protein n=1 Tax=Coniosporium apollinis (strain CBS 100218) TaxID=1168221 RepID=R7Z4S0_CONA1|nr:uncharacterized protein W97_08272 [Coniosporium apollinis CBS 100218]EON69014.1 hypothetical protein W97_08272 [Coniosporium apollinis CBS 100218]
MANPEFRFRLRDHFGNPARWPKTLNDMLIERTFELIEISPPVRRALEGNRHGDNELDLNFSNRGMVQDLINYYDSLVGSFAALEGMPEQTWPDDLQRWNRQRVRARRRPLREAINQARSFAETDLATLRCFLVERHHVAATEAGPSGTYVRPARGRGAINEPLSHRGNRAGFPVAGGEFVPIDELSRRLAETLQVEDDRQNQNAMTDVSQRLAEDLQREEADQQRRAAAEASNRLINQFREEDRRQKQAEDEASRRLVERLRDEGARERREREQASERLAADLRRQEELRQQQMDEESRQLAARLQEEEEAFERQILMNEAPVPSGRQFEREERGDYRRTMDRQPRQHAERRRPENNGEEGGAAAIRAGVRRQAEPRDDHRHRERPLGGGALARRREQMGEHDDWEEER